MANHVKNACCTRENKLQKQLDAQIRFNLVTAERNKSENKAFHNAFLTRLHSERKEAETEAACARAKESQGWRVEEVKQEDVLAREMAKDKLKDINEMKLRDFLRNSEELKELERKLRTAYIQRDLASQLVEKKAENLKKKCQEIEEMKVIAEQEKLSKEFDQLLKEQDFIKKANYRGELQDQLIDRQKIREFDYKKKLEEKVLLEESLQTILEEDKREEELRILKRQKAKEDTEAMIKARQTWIKLEKEFLEEQDRKINKYLEEKTQEEKKLQEENRKKAEMKAMQTNICVQKIQSNEEERQERDHIAQILMDEDTRLKEEERMKTAQEKKLRTYLEMKEVTTKQIEYQLQLKLNQKEEDLKIMKNIIEENEKETQREKEEVIRKKLENIQHGRQLKQLIEDQNLQKTKEIEMNYFEEQRQIELLKQRQALLADERRRLLKEHAKNLLGFLPRGVLSEVDLPHMDPEVQNYYKGKK